MFSPLIYVFFATTLIYLSFFTLNTIFSAKEKVFFKNLFGILQGTFLLASLVLFLIHALPESKNLFKISLISVVFSLAGFFLSHYCTSNTKKITGNILILLGTLVYLQILYPSFKLFKVSSFAFISSIIVYILLGFFYILLILKHRSLKKELLNLQMIFILLKTIFGCVCNFAGIITIIYDHTLYSLLFFLGMTLLVLSFLFEIAFKLKESSKKCPFLYELFFNLSLLFNSAGVIVMLI